MVDFVEFINQANSVSLGNRIRVASTFRDRFVGLLCQDKLAEGEGLLIERCNQVHMFFMRFEIGVLFLDRSLTVVGIHCLLKPWSVSKFVKEAYYCLELPPGVIETAEVRLEDRLIKR